MTYNEWKEARATRPYSDRLNLTPIDHHTAEAFRAYQRAQDHKTFHVGFRQEAWGDRSWTIKPEADLSRSERVLYTLPNGLVLVESFYSIGD